MKIRNKKRNINKQSNSSQVKCTCCAKSYKIMYGEWQGHGCASYFSIKTDKTANIYSEYGSNFDTMRFIIKNNNIAKKRYALRKSIICDTCINKNLKKGYLEIDESYDPFAVIDELNSFYQEDPQKYYEIIQQGPKDCIRLIRVSRSRLKNLFI